MNIGYRFKVSYSINNITCTSVIEEKYLNEQEMIKDFNDKKNLYDKFSVKPMELSIKVKGRWVECPIKSVNYFD